jgi:hypothetical protein
MSTPNAPSVRHSAHPYYASEGCFYWSGGAGEYPHTEHASWTEFLAEMGNADLDLNLLYRWDWHERDPGDFEPGDPEAEVEYLELFYMHQRKARPWSHRVVVTSADEPAVRAWLLDRAVHMARLWAPLLTEPLRQWELDLLAGPS